MVALNPDRLQTTMKVTVGSSHTKNQNLVLNDLKSHLNFLIL